jgi:hypothetical protein
MMLPLLMFVMLFWANHICGNFMLFMSLDPVVSLLLWGSTLQDTRGCSNYCSTKTVPQSNLSYYKIQSLHNLLKGCIEGNNNHCSLSTFYPIVEDCKRDKRYCFFAYDSAYTMPRQSQRQQVGGTY